MYVRYNSAPWAWYAVESVAGYVLAFGDDFDDYQITNYFSLAPVMV